MDPVLTRPEAAVSAGVPFLDLGAQNAGIRDELVRDFAQLVDSGAFTNGPPVHEFEAAFSSYCGVSRAAGVASGLDALRLGLLACDVGPGHEVLLPANTFIATFEAVTQVGATPVPVDVTDQDYNVDPEALAAAVSPRARAIIPVHLYGQLVDMRRVREISARHGLIVIEDACQAHGAERDGLRAGAAGTAGAFSFYPGKNLGAFGDAGAMVTDDDSIADRVTALREHGQRKKYEHREPGWTARLDTVQALVLLRKLPLLDAWNEERRAAAAAYADLLRDVGDLRLPPVPEGSAPVWHLYVVRTSRRDELLEFVRGRGIGAGLHYPEPPHLSAAYSGLGYGRGSFPVTEALASELVSLPIFPGITAAQLEVVAEAVAAFFARGG